MKEYISIKDLNFSYNKEKFITDLDFDIPKSTSIGLIGPSGSGKTTIIKLILGLLSPQKGSIKINKKIIIFQNRFLFKEEFENLMEYYS